MRTATTFSLGCLLLAACRPTAPAGPAPAGTPPQATVPAAAPAPPAGAARATATTQSPAGGATLHWQCGELLVDADAAGDALRLRFSGRSLVLPHVESLAGARHADAAGNAFGRQGDRATLVLAGGEQRDCVRSRRISPWTEAAARGIAYRAVGSEPGWLVEVGSGDDPPLHAVLDYGERTLDLPRATGISSTPGFAGKLADGTVVVLRTKNEPCSDGMSGEAFETSAELMVGDRVYRGCGAYLEDR